MKKYTLIGRARFGNVVSEEARLTILPNFELKIKPLKEKDTFVPLGIPTFYGDTENKFIEFEIEILKHGIDEFCVEILHNNKVIYTIYSGKQTLDEVIIIAKVTNPNKENQEKEEKEEETPMNYPIGKYHFKWDGFDSNGIYDSTLLTSGKLKARLKGKIESVEKIKESEEFSFKYKEVNWVDTKINKNIKRIDVTLRVNLRDGGEIGTKKDCYETGSGSYAPITKHCPWDKIPEKYLIPDFPPIQTRKKSNNFETLKQLALKGIEKYWERNNSNIGEGVYINEELYEVFFNCEHNANGMIAPKIIYFTNSEHGMFNRSHNWFASRQLFYKEGYLKGNIWYYENSSDAIIIFKETAAHEVGHRLLVQLDGEYNSYTHKRTSHWSVISQNPVKGTKYPTDGKEIDLMKYADEYPPSDYYNRVILTEKDLLGLIWLTKLELNK